MASFGPDCTIYDHPINPNEQPNEPFDKSHQNMTYILVLIRKREWSVGLFITNNGVDSNGPVPFTLFTLETV